MDLHQTRRLVSVFLCSLYLGTYRRSCISAFTLPTTSSHLSRNVIPAQRQTHLFASSVSAKRKPKKNKNKKREKAKQSQNRNIEGLGRSLTKEEMIDHVTAKYHQTRQTKSAKNNDDGAQAKLMRQLTARPTLVLNADYQPLSYLPLSLWSWQDAVKAIFSGKVVVVEVYPNLNIRAANLAVPLPSVIALTDYVSHKNHRPAFTRRNVLLRDEYKCQYCNCHFHTADLTLDHVQPRCLGGGLTWENVVSCCKKCNCRKGSMPLSKLHSVGMDIVNQPRCPSQMELAAKAARMIPRRVHPSWKPYLGIATPQPTDGRKAVFSFGDEEFIDDRYFESE